MKLIVNLCIINMYVINLFDYLTEFKTTYRYFQFL